MVRKAARELNLIGLTVTRSVTAIRGIGKSEFETGRPPLSYSGSSFFFESFRANDHEVKCL